MTAFFDFEMVDQVDYNVDNIEVLYDSFDSAHQFGQFGCRAHPFWGSPTSSCYHILTPAKQTVFVGDIAVMLYR